MNNYDAKSCSSLERAYYRPIEAALRWCNLIEHEVEVLEKTGQSLYPAIADFPQWPCLRINAEKIFEATQNNELPHGRDGRTVSEGDHVASYRVTVRHNDLKLWIAKYYPDQKPKFLFDEVERTTHTAINKDAFIALQVERDALKVRIEKAEVWAKDKQSNLKELNAENEKLRSKVTVNEANLNNKERESLIKIIYALAKNGYKYPNHGALSDIVRDFQANNNGVTENTLTKYLKEFDSL